MQRFADSCTPTLAAVLGVCGGVASGKSSACAFLASHDSRALHVNADALAHAAYAPGGPAYARVAALFPSAVRASDATIDRAALGRIIFGDARARSDLEAAVWPAVAALALEDLSSRAAARAARGEPPAVGVIEAALLLEAGWAQACDGVWLIRVPRDVAVARVQARANAPSTDVATTIVDAQATAEVRLTAAEAAGVTVDSVIDSNQPVDGTRAQIAAAWGAFLKKRGLGNPP